MKRSEAVQLLSQLQEAKRVRREVATSGTTHKSLVRSVLGGPHDGRAPAARIGEDIMGSRGYEFHRLAALQLGWLQPGECKIELETKDFMDRTLRSRSPGWTPAARGVVAPFAPGLFRGSAEGEIFSAQEVGGMVQKMLQGTASFDPDEATWLTTKAGVVNTTKQYNPDTVRTTNQSWQIASTGGALVPFPEMGPLIPLFRNKNAAMNAGATVMPMPPMGRLAFPRQTTASVAGNVGEGIAVPNTSVGTDQLTLSSKKIGAYIQLNNELIRYGGPVVEQLFRNDLTISLSLKMDYDILQGAGSATVIAGLLGYPGVQSFNGTGSGATTNGYTLAPQDIYTMIANVYAANAEFEAWIIRPELWGYIQGKRTSVLTTGDGLGMFLFAWNRGFDSQGVTVDQLGGTYRVVRTAQVPVNRVKSAGTNLTALYGGMFSNLYIALYGTVEFATSEQGAGFTTDQTLIRAILSGDAGPRNPGAFIVADQLLPTTVGS